MRTVDSYDGICAPSDNEQVDAVYGTCFLSQWHNISPGSSFRCCSESRRCTHHHKSSDMITTLPTHAHVNTVEISLFCCISAGFVIAGRHGSGLFQCPLRVHHAAMLMRWQFYQLQRTIARRSQYQSCCLSKMTTCQIIEYCSNQLHNTTSHMA